MTAVVGNDRGGPSGGAGVSQPVRQAVGAASGPVYCDGCGQPADAGDHARCRARRAATDPPRWCTDCGRKLVVQVLPVGWTARCVSCGPLPR